MNLSFSWSEWQIAWSDIEALFSALGTKISEGNGSRVRVELNGERAVFHRPHPESNTDKGAVKSVRRFLENAEVTNYKQSSAF